MVKLSNYAKIFKALSNEQRLKIFIMIYKQCCQAKGASGKASLGKGGSVEKAFSMVCECMNLSKSTISHHIKELQHAGIVSCERFGRNFRCTVNKEAFNAIKEFFK
jgi:ArsR family transcriptional regulator